ncbi:hypothetical protein JCM6882_003444 [Rhodosporidiobolus microsporus]
MPGVRHYLDLTHLRRLDSYSYSAVDKSPLSNYVMRHWWTWSASLMPPWLAPNCITLIGFAAVILNFVTVWLAVPGLVGGEGKGLWWVYGSCAAGLFFYQTMDNIDGKQARRTGTGSPMGEMFDHGCDTLNCPLSGIIQAAAFGLGHSPYALLCVLIPCWSMYVSTWEEYHTGTLYLGYINGPVEGILLGVLVLLISTINGPSWWANSLSDTVMSRIPPFAFFPGHWQVLDAVMWSLLGAFLVAHLPLCLWNVYKHLTLPRRRPLTSRPSSNGRINATPPAEAFRQLLPIIGFTLFAAAWVLSPKSSMLREGRLIEFAVLVCFLYGQLSSKIIIAQLTRGVFPYSPTLLIPLALPAILVNTPYLHLPSLLPPTFEAWYLHLCVLGAFASYAVDAHAVLKAFCGYLGIRALSIPFPNKACEGYVAVPGQEQPTPAAPRLVHQSPAVGSFPPGAEEYELQPQQQLQPLISSPPSPSRSPSSPSRPSPSRSDSSASTTSRLSSRPSRLFPNGFLNVKSWIDVQAPSLLGAEGGRKRSNTSEREKGVGMGPEGMREEAPRRVATVGAQGQERAG